MTKKLILGVIVFTFSMSSYARCIGPVVNGECLGTEVYGTEDNSNYEGNSGAQYQYDLNDLSDSINYSHDIDAQRRDQMNIDTRRNLDNSIGQNGGGIYNGNDD